MLVGISVFLIVTGLQAQMSLNQSSSNLDSLTIVAFGNSITAERKTITAVFAQRLPALLEKEGITAKVINAGIGGSHTGRRIDHDLFKIRHALDRFESDVLEKNPDLTIIGFGTNDSAIDAKVEGGDSRIPLKAYKSNLKFIISTLKENGSKVILIAPNCLGAAYPEFRNERLYKYVKVVRRLARKYKTGLFDNYAFFREYDRVSGQSMDDLMLDGVHPNDLGHEFMAARLSKEILRIMAKYINK
ncbi:MAG: G-D-S-L family lipolytic protein [Saprospiraceae bacterium]|nr:G-D-S-L family lipolytic protein [Saprospiraceae bacterium]